jgi:hypothetical protein
LFFFGRITVADSVAELFEQRIDATFDLRRPVCQLVMFCSISELCSLVSEFDRPLTS